MSIFYKVRREYDQTFLTEDSLTDSPYTLFQIWLDDLIKTDVVLDHTAMILATVDENQMPYQRTVLMKAFDESGFVFFTNKKSRKGKQLAQNPNACVMFPWLALERQVVVNGSVVELREEDNDAYFASRPKSSKVAAVVSQQSQPIKSRSLLDEEFTKMMAEMNDDVPRPAHWGGYKVVPSSIEFWQGGENRLHDRFIYTAQNDGKWSVTRYQP